MARSAPEPPLIGVVECVDFPEWRIFRLPARIDTGARTSALHVENIRELGAFRVRFDVRLSKDESNRRVTVEARIARRGQVRSSNGQTEARVFVAVRVRIGPLTMEIELSLVDRGRMKFRLLIGRRALAHNFLIDPSRRYVLTGALLTKSSPARSTRFAAPPGKPALAKRARKKV